MNKIKQIRFVGTVVAVGGCILFITGAMTDHWAENYYAHFGLWSYCTTMAVHNSSSLINSTIYNTTVSVGSSEQNATDEDDESCDQFSFSAIPAQFHMVRALVACGAAFLAYTALSGRLLKQNIERKNNFICTHRGELVGILGGLFGFGGIRVFMSSFKSYQFDDYAEPHLDTSAIAAFFGSILIICGPVIMMVPTFRLEFMKWRAGSGNCLRSISIDSFKNNPLGTCYQCLLCQQRQRSPATEPVSTELQARRNSFSSIIYNSEEQGDSYADVDLNSISNIFTVDVGDSSPSPSRPGHFSNPDASYGDPAPRYEDLSPTVREDMPPPPPSYDEAILGQYAVTDTSRAGATTPTSPASFASILISDNADSPPPGYEETVA